MSRPTSVLEGFDEDKPPLVQDVMKAPLVTVQSRMNIKDAVSIMNQKRLGSLVVVDVARPIGIITERDILQKVIEPDVSPATLIIGDIMSSPVITARFNETLEKAVEQMVSKGIRRLVVVNEKQEAVGIITSSDVMRTFPVMVKALKKLAR